MHKHLNPAFFYWPTEGDSSRCKNNFIVQKSMDKQVKTPLLCDLNKYFSDPKLTADMIEKEAYHRVDIPVV